MYQKAPIVRKYSVFKVRGGAAQRPVAYITVRGWVIGTGRVDKDQAGMLVLQMIQLFRILTAIL